MPISCFFLISASTRFVSASSLSLYSRSAASPAWIALSSSDEEMPIGAKTFFSCFKSRFGECRGRKGCSSFTLYFLKISSIFASIFSGYDATIGQW